MSVSFEIRVCENPACGLRYPLVKGHPFGERCPLCLGPTTAALTRDLTVEPVPPLNRSQGTLEALLDNIRSAWNVGAIFRTADGLGVQKLHLCGITPTPDNPKVAKTALGAEHSVDWIYHLNAVQAARELKSQGFHICALEASPPSCSIFQVPPDLFASPILLVVGNEVTGVDSELLNISDIVLSIPMHGKKESLNVSLAFGIAAYTLRFSRFVTFP